MKWTFPRFALLLAIVLLIWFWPSVFGGKAFLPLDLLWQHAPNTPPPGVTGVHNYLIGDMLYENFTWKLLRQRCLAAGEWPLWNPYAFCGHPLYTTGQAATFYPLDVVFLLLPLPHAYAAFLALHLWLGGLFQYAFLRRIGVAEFGAAAGGVIFAMCGFFATKMVFPMALGSGIWLPLMLLWIVKLSSSLAWRRTGMHIAIGAVIFAMPLLGGFFEIAFYCYITAALFVVARCAHLWFAAYQLRRTDERATAASAVSSSAALPGCTAPAGGAPGARQGFLRGLWLSCAGFCGKVLATVALAAMLTAPQVLPFLEVKDLNIRVTQADYKKVVGQALNAENLLVAVAPDIFGNPAQRAAWDLRERQLVPIHARNGADNYYFGTKNYVENGCYLGLLPLLLAPLSLRMRGRHRIFFWLLLAISLAMAFGTPLYAAFYYTVPGFKQLRTPFRWLFVSTFAVASLAAIGAEYWFHRLRDPAGAGSRAIVAVLLVVPLALVWAIVAALFFPDAVRLLAERTMAAIPRVRSTFPDAWALAGFMWANAFRFALFLLAAVVVLAIAYVRAWGRPGAAVASLLCFGLLAADAGLSDYGFNTQTDPAWLDRVAPSVKYMQADKGLFRVCRFGPTKVLYPNLPTVYGLQDVGGYDSIILTDYVRYLQAIEPQYLLIYNIVLGFDRARSLDSPLLPLLNIRYMLTAGRVDHRNWELVFQDGMRVYRNRRELPRAFMVHRAESVSSLDEALKKMADGSFDSASDVLLETSPSELPPLLRHIPPKQSPVGVTHYGYTNVELTTNVNEPGVVVLCDVMYPGWRAYVDGRAAPIFKANGIFRAVGVPAGNHRVSFRFQPAPLRRGAVLLASGVIIMAALIVLPRLRASR